MFDSHIQSSTPTSEGLTALSSYVLACLMFVFCAKLEFAFVLFVKRNYTRNEKKSIRVEQGKKPNSNDDGRKSSKWSLEEIEEEKDKKAEKGCCSLFDKIDDVDEFCYRADKIAFVVFALSFSMYVFVYVIVYTA